MPKRLFDAVVAAVALIVLSPLMLVIALVVRFDIGESPIFRQLRPGRNGKLFEMLKFRTMREKAAEDGTPLADHERLTTFGRWLRSTSLDELPGLVNVLRGDMSLVGPRPLLREYLALYSPEQARRHDVRPGITGWAQVNGRNALSWSDKFAHDLWYVDHQSFWLDIRILGATVLKVIAREGVRQDGHATTEKFRGNNG